jgi:hypothetical protein
MLVKRNQQNIKLIMTVAERPTQKNSPAIELPGWME